MKILVLTSSDKKDLKTESDHELIFRRISKNQVLELHEAAYFAEEQNCELMAVIPEAFEIDILKEMLKSLPDQDSPTALFTTYQSKDLQPDKKQSQAMLMLQLLTGEKIYGFQNELKIYPVKLLKHISEKIYGDQFFHVKILIKASKAGYKIISSKIENKNQIGLKRETPRYFYFIPELLKTLIPWPNKRLCPKNFQKEKAREFLLHPLKFIKFLLLENATPGGLAMAAACGMFLGTLPLLGVHTAAIIYVSIKLRLNKMLSVNISHLCMPPFVPFACIELGHYILHEKWLTLDTLNKIFKEASLSGFGSIFLEWIIGSLILAPANAFLFATITYIISAYIKSGIKKR